MKKVIPILLIFLAACCFLWPALYNGYPLVYSDTGTYIYSGFQGEVPVDRPISYGLFLRHSSLSASLWFSMLTQALLIATLIFYLSKKIWVQSNNYNFLFGLLCLTLLLTTGVSWFVSMAMADFFSSFSFLLFFILVFFPPTNRWLFYVLIPLYFFSTSTHLTHAPAHLFVVIVLLITKLLSKFVFVIQLSWKQWLFSLFLVLGNFLFLPTLHYMYSKEFVSAKGGQIHLLSRQVENGALKEMLVDNCQTVAYVLCNYQDSLPQTAPDFLWNENGPLSRIGGWKTDIKEIGKMNQKIFSTPKYLKIYLHHYFVTVYHQLFYHSVGEELFSLGLNSPPGWEIDNHFKEEKEQFLAAKQANSYWVNKLKGLSSFYSLMVLFSFLVIFSVWFLIKGPSNIKTFAFCALFYWFGNLLTVCIASSGSRYNSRIDWLLVFAAVLILYEFWEMRRRKAILV